MLVKICGITQPGDAEAAVQCGAGALGFVFWPKSPRFVDPYRARAIVRSLPPFIATVGVFVNQPPEYVNGVASLVGLSAVQLHGDETPAFAAEMRRPVIKAIAIGGGTDGAVVDGWAAGRRDRRRALGGRLRRRTHDRGSDGRAGDRATELERRVAHDAEEARAPRSPESAAGSERRGGGEHAGSRRERQ